MSHTLQPPSVGEPLPGISSFPDTANTALHPHPHPHQHSHPHQPPPPPPPPPHPSNNDFHLPRIHELDPISMRQALPPISSSLSSHGSHTALPSLAQLIPAPNALHSSAQPPAQPHHMPSFSDLRGVSTSSSMTFQHNTMDSEMSGMGSPEYMRMSRASSFHEDNDLRLVAQALAEMKTGAASTQHSPQIGHSTLHDNNSPRQPPLLSILSKSHPFLATTIDGAAQAYNNSKNFSPRFKSGAEYVESCLNPIANTVGNVSRATGVEGGVRWILGGRRPRQQPADQEPQEQQPSLGSSKRRKANDGASVAASEDGDPHERRLSMASSTRASIPPYDDSDRASEYHSPPQSGSTGPDGQPTANGAIEQHSRARPHNMGWRLIRSTTGLGAAMNGQSLRSLKYCLAWLRKANKNMDNKISTLKNLIEEYDRAEARERQARQRNGVTSNESAERSSLDENSDLQMLDSIAEPSEGGSDGLHEGQERTDADSNRRGVPRTPQEVGQRITRLRSEVVNVLQDTVKTISMYAGASLPVPARHFVRRSLLSLPARSAGAAKAQQLEQQAALDRGEEPNIGAATRRNAQTALLVAKEGLHVILQISHVLDNTIGSAEEWCERLGRKPVSIGATKDGMPAGGPNGGENAVMEEDEEELRPPTTAEKRPLEA